LDPQHWVRGRETGRKPVTGQTALLFSEPPTSLIVILHFCGLDFIAIVAIGTARRSAAPDRLADQHV
jgi:hypothetical protein